MKTWIGALAMVCIVGSLPARAAEGESGLEQLEKPSKVVRQESLEIPGLTACHQCEWRPKPHTKAAPEQCGKTPEGTARMGIFECGFSQECDRVCNFVQCAE